jgi:glutathione S-transferase
MSVLVLTTYDWAPAGPRGYGRDLRVRWALEEARLPDRVEFLKSRLARMEHVLAKRQGLARNFSRADILMSDVLRLVGRFDGLASFPACRHTVARATARPALVKAHADQMADCAQAG